MKIMCWLSEGAGVFDKCVSKIFFWEYILTVSTRKPSTPFLSQRCIADSYIAFLHSRSSQFRSSCSGMKIGDSTDIDSFNHAC